MWQNYSAPKSKRPKFKKKQINGNREFHIKRVPAQVSPRDPRSEADYRLNASIEEKDVVAARMVLNEFNPSKISIYSSKPIEVGSEIRLTLLQPKTFYCKALVESVQDLTINAKVITNSPFRYRVKLTIVHENELEKKRIEKYWKLIQNDHLYPIRKKIA